MRGVIIILDLSLGEVVHTHISHARPAPHNMRESGKTAEQQFQTHHMPPSAAAALPLCAEYFFATHKLAGRCNFWRARARTWTFCMVNISFKGGSFHNKSRAGVIIFTPAAHRAENQMLPGASACTRVLLFLLLNRVCCLSLMAAPAFPSFHFAQEKTNDKSFGWSGQSAQFIIISPRGRTGGVDGDNFARNTPLRCNFYQYALSTQCYIIHRDFGY